MQQASPGVGTDGLVLTNSHVIHGHREVGLTDTEGRVMDARLIGEDLDTDLALLRVTAARQLTAAPIGIRSCCAAARS